MSGRVFIAAEKPQQCDLCGKVAELRPYGPGGACICYECGRKHPAEVERRMGAHLFGDPLPASGDRVG